MSNPSGTGNPTERQWRWRIHSPRVRWQITWQASNWNPEVLRKRKGRPWNTWPHDQETDVKETWHNSGQFKRLAQDWNAWRNHVVGLSRQRGDRVDWLTEWSTKQNNLTVWEKYWDVSSGYKIYSTTQQNNQQNTLNTKISTDDRPSVAWQIFHLMQTGLIKWTRVNVDHMTIVGSSGCESLIMLQFNTTYNIT